MNSRDGMNVDVLCSAGKMLHPYGYYDTFATVLLPDTFVYPVGGRPVMTARPEEDASLIIGPNFSAEALMDWFHKEGGVDARPVPVKSCFGGLAIYRASKWLDQRCSYKDQFPEVNAKYANKYDNAPCEHVVMHNCLHAVDPAVVVAVQPDMHTIWHTSAGPQYALSNHPDLAANFVLDHIDLVRESRRLEANYTSPYYNTSAANFTWFFGNSSNLTNFFDVMFKSSNCSSTNFTANEYSNNTLPPNNTLSLGANCTEISQERRMAEITEIVRMLYERSLNCTNVTNATMMNCTGLNCTNVTNATMTNCTSISGNSTAVFFNGFIQWVYESAGRNATSPNGNFTNSTYGNFTNTTFELTPDIDTVPENNEVREALEMHNKPKLDFFIAGFPKCGTTSSLFAFNNNEETSIGKSEQCAVSSAGITDEAAWHALDTELANLSQDPSVKRGIKCPIGLENARSIDRIDQHSPEAKLLIGVRHPIKYFQSYYNYRITEIYDHNLPMDNIPPIESLIGKHEWKGVSTDSARFELYLMQLGKTNMSVRDFAELKGRPYLAVKPNYFKIFLYTISQMEDEVAERKENFRDQMRKFLGLKKPLPVIARANKNVYVGKKAHKETIDICDSKYDALRALLVEQGKETQRWIRDEFIQSPDVVVGNKDHFLAMLDTWSHDPCREYLAEGGDGSSSGIWMYIKGFMAPFFDMVSAFFS
jgi:hypothetical protein